MSQDGVPNNRAAASICKKTAKRAPAEADAPQNREVALRLLLCARFGRSIPRATGLHAIGLGLCGGGPREGWTCEGKCEGHCKSRNKNFHDVFSLTLTLVAAANEPTLEPLCSRNTRFYRVFESQSAAEVGDPRRGHFIGCHNQH
jgi:hypothetical protein